MEGKYIINPKFALWTNNDGLLMTWLRGMMNEEVISTIVREQMTHQVSISIKDLMFSSTKRTRKLVEGNYQPLGNRSWMMTKYFNLPMLLVPSMLI